MAQGELADPTTAQAPGELKHVPWLLIGNDNVLYDSLSGELAGALIPSAMNAVDILCCLERIPAR